MSEADDTPASDEAPATDAEGPALVLLDPSIDPETLRALEAELGHTIRLLEPVPLDPELPGEDDLAIIVPLELGAVSGIDLIESLRARASLDDLPIAVASATPTRRRVRAALRAGATTWLSQPYDPHEWKQRLGEELARVASAAVRPEASDEEPPGDEAEEASA